MAFDPLTPFPEFGPEELPIWTLSTRYPVWKSKTRGGDARRRTGFRSTMQLGPVTTEVMTLWHSDGVTSKIYNLSQTGSVISSFATPSSNPRGIGYDSAGCIWHADNTADKIYKLNQAGGVISSFASPSSNPSGLSVESGGCIWHADYTADKIYKLNQAGGVISSFASPDITPKGVGLGPGGCIWHGDSFTNKIYRLNQAGSVVSSFVIQSPGDHDVQGVGVDRDGSIWYSADDDAAADNEIIYETQAGALRGSFRSPGNGPRGLETTDEPF